MATGGLIWESKWIAQGWLWCRADLLLEQPWRYWETLRFRQNVHWHQRGSLTSTHADFTRGPGVVDGVSHHKLALVGHSLPAMRRESALNQDKKHIAAGPTSIHNSPDLSQEGREQVGRLSTRLLDVTKSGECSSDLSGSYGRRGE
jgi:hypothetical protein